MEELSGFFSSCWLQVIAAILASYLVSSVNTSIIVTKIVMHQDIRNMGSGNAGFTNVLRCVGKGPAAITFVGDFLKGVVSVGIAMLLMLTVKTDTPDLYRGYLMYIAGLFAVVGHTFPVYYKFKGGKGVVTSFAVMLMTDWRTLVCALVIFAVVFLICHIISVCALFNYAIYTFTAFTWRYLDYCGITSAVSPLPAPTLPFVFFSAFIALLIGIMVIVRHKDNIIRLRNGTEKKIHAKQ